MKIEIWSDVVCPWCYIGKRRIEAAIEQFDEPIEVEWRSFELDPRAPTTVEGPLVEALARKYRMPATQAQAMMERVTSLASAEGLEMNFDRAQTGNTFDAHRVLQHARKHGKAEEMKERLMRAYFTEGAEISSHAVLTRLAVDVGLDEAEVIDVLASDAHADDVRADESEAQAIGATGVPFFRINGRFGVSGAQEVSTFLLVLEQAREQNA